MFCYPSGCVGRDWSCANQSKDLRSIQRREAARNSPRPPRGSTAPQTWQKRGTEAPGHLSSPWAGRAGPAAPARAEVGAGAFLLPLGASLSHVLAGQRAAPGWHLPAAAPQPCPGAEGTAKPASPAAISCPIRRAIKNNRHRHCPGPAAAAGGAEVAAWKTNQFPALVGRNHSVSWSRSRRGLQSPGQ